MLQNPQSKNIFYKITPQNPIWFWLCLTVIFIICSIGVYSSFFYREASLESAQRKVKELQEARNVISALRQELEQQKSSAQLRETKLANQEILDKISDNFKKIFIFSKLERRVLTGKNFSSAFEKLDSLMGQSLKNPRFNILRENTKGITPPTGIETSFRSYTPPQSHHEDTLGEKMFYFFNSFFRIRSFQEKEKTDTLCQLIRNDHTQKAIDFIDKNMPEYREWSQALQRRFEAKQALRDLEQLVFHSLRI